MIIQQLLYNRSNRLIRVDTKNSERFQFWAASRRATWLFSSSIFWFRSNGFGASCRVLSSGEESSPVWQAGAPGGNFSTYLDFFMRVFFGFLGNTLALRALNLSTRPAMSISFSSPV